MSPFSKQVSLQRCFPCQAKNSRSCKGRKKETTCPASPCKKTSSCGGQGIMFLITVKTSWCAPQSFIDKTSVLKQTSVCIQTYSYIFNVFHRKRNPKKIMPQYAFMHLTCGMQHGQCATGPCVISKRFMQVPCLRISLPVHCNQLPASFLLKSKTKQHPKASTPGVVSTLKLGLNTTPPPVLRPFSKALNFYSSILPTWPPPQAFQKGKGGC